MYNDYLMPTLTLIQKITFALESFLVTHFLKGKPRGLLRALFRAPIFFHRIGLGALAGKNILVLVTTGRKTGLPRYTGLGYSFSPETQTYLVLTGWGGRSDWYLNAIATPNVEIWVGKEKFKAIALTNSLDTTVDILKQTAMLNPRVLHMWESYTGIPADGSSESYLKLAEKMPSMNLVVGKIPI